MDNKRSTRMNNFNNSFSGAIPDGRDDTSPLKKNEKDAANTSFTEDMGGVYKSMKKTIIGRFNRTNTSQQDISSPRSEVQLRASILPKDIEEYKKQLAEKDIQIKDLSEKLKIYESNDQAKFVQQQKSQMSNLKKIMQDKIKALAEEAQQKDKQMQQLQEQLKAQQDGGNTKDTLDDSQSSVKNNNTEKDVEIARLNKENDELRQQMINVQRDLVAYSKDKSQFQAEIDKLRQDNSLQNQQIELNEQNYQKLQQQYQDHLKQINQLNKDILKKTNQCYVQFLSKDDNTRFLTSLPKQPNFDILEEINLQLQKEEIMQLSEYLIEQKKQYQEIINSQRTDQSQEIQKLKLEHAKQQKESDHNTQLVKHQLEVKQKEIDNLKEQITKDQQHLQMVLAHQNDHQLTKKEQEDFEKEQLYQQLRQQEKSNYDLQRQVEDYKYQLQDRDMTQSAQNMIALNLENQNSDLLKEIKELKDQLKLRDQKLETLQTTLANKDQELATVKKQQQRGPSHTRINSTQSKISSQSGLLPNFNKVNTSTLTGKNNQDTSFLKQDVSPKMQLEEKKQEQKIQELRKDMQLFNTFIGVLCALVFLIFSYTFFKNYQEPISIYLSGKGTPSNMELNRQ